MSLKFSISMAAAAASLSLAGHIQAQNTYAEQGDAGGLPTTAQVAAGAANTPLTSITGTTTLTNNVADTDMYEIYVSSPSTFSASTTAFHPGSNNFDDQLSLFTSTGVGVVSNDDTSNGDQADLPAGSLTLGVGNYYLLISGEGTFTVDSTGNEIFPFPTTAGEPNYTAVIESTDASPVTGYTDNSDEAGKYVIALTGAEFVDFANVPEPSAFAFGLVGAAGMALAFRARRCPAK